MCNFQISPAWMSLVLFNFHKFYDCNMHLFLFKGSKISDRTIFELNCCETGLNTQSFENNTCRHANVPHQIQGNYRAIIAMNNSYLNQSTKVFS